MRPLTRNSSGGTSHIGLLLLFLAVASHSAWAKPQHYTFILPDKYVGWVQIIFNDPQAPPLHWRKDKGCEIEVPESGISRSPSLRIEVYKSYDEFYYRSTLPSGTIKLLPVPSEYVMPGFSHGGFGVMDTGGKGKGYSWFIFIGPPALRAKVPLANWDKVVEDYAKAHGGKTRIESSGPYPTPGRMGGEYADKLDVPPRFDKVGGWPRLRR